MSESLVKEVVGIGAPGWLVYISKVCLLLAISKSGNPERRSPSWGSPGPQNVKASQNKEHKKHD